MVATYFLFRKDVMICKRANENCKGNSITRGYGYLKGTSSMDGSGIDVYVGTGENRVNAIICIVDLLKRDSEIKILIGCSEEEKSVLYKMHNETQFMKGILIRR